MTALDAQEGSGEPRRPAPERALADTARRVRARRRLEAGEREQAVAEPPRGETR